jgi:RNA recognition motif. (a.k.a. RRM, RBD, or RNP domain)
MAQKLFIGGLSFSTPTERLRGLFAQIDGVQSVTIVTDRETGQSRGFGFVEVETTEAANRAVAKLNGVQLDGRASGGDLEAFGAAQRRRVTARGTFRATAAGVGKGRHATDV